MRAASTILQRTSIAAVLLGALAAVTACAPRARRPAAPEPVFAWPAAGPCSSDLEKVVAVDEPTPLGFSAIDVIQRLGGTRTSRLVWLDPPRSDDYLLEFGPERQISELSLSLTLAPGDIGLRRAIVNDAEGDAECGEDVLLIPVEVVVESRERALAESFRAVLEASSPHRGRLSARFDAAALGGGLVFTEPQSLDPQRAFHIGAVELALLVWQGGSHGRVSIEIRASSPKDDVIVAPPAEPHPLVAVWPSAAPCDAGWTALPPDATLSGTSAASVVATLAEQPAEALRWSDGSAAELRLGFEALSNELCQSTGGVLEFEAALRAQSSDGRVDAVVPVRVSAKRDGAEGRAGAFHEIEITRAGADAASPDVELEARYWRDGAEGSLQVHAANAGNDREAPPLTSGEWSR